MEFDQAIRSGPLGISVLVCGAGVGGLMTALECWRRGCDVRVFERASHRVTAGDSFMIGPTAINSFRNWPGLLRRNEEIAYNPLVAYHKLSGERISGPVPMEDQLSSAGGAMQTKPKLYRHARPKFQGMLFDQLEALGIHVQYGKEVKSYSEDMKIGKAVVRLMDGSVHEADLIVAADGVRGKSWPLVAGHEVPARSSGDAIFRVAYPVEYAMADPMVAERFQLTPEGKSVVERWVGPGMFAAFWRSEDEMSIGIQHTDHGTAEESWSHRVSPDEILKLTATIPDWPEVADRAIKTIPPGLLMDFKLMWRDPQPRWTSPGGLVVQVGDAAHTFLPTSANGGTQAIEDAVSLATCLHLAGQRSKIPEATQVHNLLRFERVSCMQAFGVANRKKHKTEIKAPKGSQKSPVMFPRWITDHDPESYALKFYQAAAAHLNSGERFQNSNIPPGIVYRHWTIDSLLEAQEKGEPTVLDGDWT